jgi:PAS domain S-box-containing protein
MTVSSFEAFEAVAAVVVVLDLDDRIVYWNKACSCLTGYFLEEVRGRRLAEFLLPPDEVELVQRASAVMRAQDRASPLANYWITKSGDRRWIFWSNAAIEGPDGRGPYIIKTGVDGTNQKEAEDRLASELARRDALAIENARLFEDALRTAKDLREANQQMVIATVQANELMEQANAARERTEQREHELRKVAEFRERFIGILGHDLRNPLSAISMTAASLLRASHLGEQDDRKVTRILHSSQRMTRMISQLLDLTRARLGGGFPLEPRATDLRDVCNGVIDEFGAAIDVQIEGDVTGTWDPDRLAEVLSNITGNAIEHAAPGTRVGLSVRADDAEVVLEIVNQGEPIPADVLPFIFEPFRQAKPREKTAAGNLGLGLYIAKQIVESAGGAIEARSSERTTAFSVRLPRTRPVDPEIQGAPHLPRERRVSNADRRVGDRRSRGSSIPR